MAEFTEEFNVEEPTQTSDWVKYRRLIGSLRARLGVRYSHDRPVLPRQQKPPGRWFDIILRTNSPRAITLRIRLDNLYLDGYRVESSGQWFEFGSSASRPLIHGSTFLGFGGHYVDLRRFAVEVMENINLGQTQLASAVTELDDATTSSQVRARALIVVIQMICESIRFERISNHLATTFRSGSPPPLWMLALETKWEDLSTALLRADADPDYVFPILQLNDVQIRTAEEAVAAIGILIDS
ncbi:rRNA N-glycosidase [Cocos nucifera]|nr:rRNA N-glycosidase [Cocos nucifera]